MYRLTLVKAWNTDELESYAELVSRGKPDFIEVKVLLPFTCSAVFVEFIWRKIQGVTYCGDSKASSLTMENVPWHQEASHHVILSPSFCAWYAYCFASFSIL